jgi:hypothetical protein
VASARHSCSRWARSMQGRRWHRVDLRRRAWPAWARRLSLSGSRAVDTKESKSVIFSGLWRITAAHAARGHAIYLSARKGSC